MSHLYQSCLLNKLLCLKIKEKINKKIKYSGFISLNFLDDMDINHLYLEMRMEMNANNMYLHPTSVKRKIVKTEHLF